MFWILRRTGAVNFFNSINNNYSPRANAVNNLYHDSGKSTNSIRYGKLSVVDSECCNQHDDVDGDLLVNMKHPYCKESTQKTLSIDKNGNSNCRSDNLNNNSSFCVDTDDGSDNGNEKEKIKSAVNRLQALAMSDDEDFDESLCCNVCDRAFHFPRQLASHQQKKRHFGCGGCDTLFPSLMLLEHHKEEYEHWSDSEEYQRPCCRRNRRDDFDYTESDSCTSEAESEDMERLL